MPRIVGIDVARGLAVLGMMTAHVGPDDHGPVPPGGWSQLADGRPSALFVVLAGISLALLSGGEQPVGGTDLRRARARILTRAGVVLVLGLGLQALGTPVVVILPTYAVLFTLGCLVLRLRPVVLAASAAAVAVLGPVLRLALVDALGQDRVGADAFATLWVGEFYPVVVWLAYLLAGLALGRLDLTSGRVRAWAAAAGTALVAAGHLGSHAALAAGWTTRVGTAEPHSSTTFEVVGNTGVALLVVAVCLAVAARAPRLVAPVAAVGALALTAYTVHVVAIAVLGEQVVWQPRVSTWAAFLLLTTGGCWLWRATLGRGPLERVLHGLSTGLADALVPPAPTEPDRERELS